MSIAGCRSDDFSQSGRQRPLISLAFLYTNGARPIFFSPALIGRRSGLAGSRQLPPALTDRVTTVSHQPQRGVGPAQPSIGVAGGTWDAYLLFTASARATIIPWGFLPMNMDIWCCWRCSCCQALRYGIPFVWVSGHPSIHAGVLGLHTAG